MAEKTGDKTFQRMALGLMALTGIGTLLHAVHDLYRDIRPKRDNTRPAPQAQPAEPHASKPDGSVGPQSRMSDRPAESERLWTDTVSRQAHGRHR